MIRLNAAFDLEAFLSIDGQKRKVDGFQFVQVSIAVDTTNDRQESIVGPDPNWRILDRLDHPFAGFGFHSADTRVDGARPHEDVVLVIDAVDPGNRHERLGDCAVNDSGQPV